MKTYLVVTVGSMLLALAGTSIAIRLARILRLLDTPGVRKVHAVAVPRIGGVAILLATLLMVGPVLALDNVIGDSFRSIQGRLVALFAGSLLMFALGLADDIRGLRPRVKLGGQLLVAAGVCAFGVRVEQVTLPGELTVDLGGLGYPLTVLWIVGITNAINLIDGLDGLAAGIAAIACGVIATLAILTNQPVMAVLMLALLGSLCGFLFFNFNPAKVFMGDCGSLFLGFVLGAGSVLCATKTATIIGLAIPLLAVGVPVFDMLFSMMRRFLERRSPLSPDRGHIHHRLLDIGLSQRWAVIALYAVTFMAAGLGMFMMAARDVVGIVVFGCVTMFLVGVFRLVGAVRLRESLATLQRTLWIGREIRQERRHFEESQLRLREAKSFEAWWQSVCEAAEKLEFLFLSLTIADGGDASRVLVWQRPPMVPTTNSLLELSFLVRSDRFGQPLCIEAQVGVNGSLEAAGRRGALFGRLMDEFGSKAFTSDTAVSADVGRRSG